MIGRTIQGVLSLFAFLLVFCSAVSANGQSADELVERRNRLAHELTDGLVILPARIQEKAMEQPAWIQEPSFQYFTGLSTIPGSILVVDTRANSHVLFAAGAPLSFGIPLDTLDIQNRPDLIEASGLDAVLPMDRFIPWVNSRLGDTERQAVIYLNEARQPSRSTLPESMPPVSGGIASWRYSLEKAFPDTEIRSAAAVIRELRWQKSAVEIKHLRRNGMMSAAALKAGMRAIQQGSMQRTAESAVVAACLEAGAEGPSFWPWVMSGPNAHIGSVVRSFFDYSHLNRAFQPGELVRADIGCMSGGYGGDVGRTVPVSGLFTPEQGRIWDLLVIGYRAGVSAMKPGMNVEDVAEASRRAIRQQRGQSPELDSMIDIMTGNPGVAWHIHGVGIESGETPGPVLVEGAVLAYEPMISIGEHAYYLEDMWLITDSGAENLTPGLPTTRQELESFLSR
jgi:Xaa-Pro aminopeptidase